MNSLITSQGAAARTGPHTPSSLRSDSQRPELVLYPLSRTAMNADDSESVSRYRMSTMRLLDERTAPGGVCQSRHIIWAPSERIVEQGSIIRSARSISSRAPVGELKADLARLAAGPGLFDRDHDRHLLTARAGITGLTRTGEGLITFTTPDSRFRSRRTIPRRSLYIQAHAGLVRLEAQPPLQPCVDTPFLCEVTNQIAAN
jgi:hypothetical protein